MYFKSWIQHFARTWRHNRGERKATRQRAARPLVELLEDRELLAAPTLVASGILPADGSTLATASPILQVQFSETMSNSALTPGNYVLLGAAGNSIPINSVNFVPIGGAPANSAVQLTYNSGNPLVVDSYSLFLRGDRIVDQDEGLPLAQPGQLVIANAGRSNVTVSTMPGDGSIGAISNYIIPLGGTTVPTPRAIISGDFDGDGISDLAVVSATTESVSIYQGQSTAEGGGFQRTPDLTLTLATATVFTNRGVAVGDLNNDSKLDLVVSNFDNSTVTVFLNTRATVGVLAFNAGTAVTTDTNPTGVAIADIDGNNQLDLVVSIASAATDISTPADSVLDYRIQVFPGDGLGGFTAAPVRVRVGDTATGLQTPNTAIPGLFNTAGPGTPVPWIAVSGANGLIMVANTSTPGTIALAAQFPLISTTPLTNLVAGQYDAGGVLDVAGIDSTSRMNVFTNLGNATFAPPTLIPIPTGVGTRLAAGDLSGDAYADIVVPGGTAATGLTTMVNATVGGSISSASNPPTGDIVVTSKDHHLLVGQTYSVVISGATGNTNANGTRAITVIDADRFSLNGVSGNANYTGGGVWALTSTITTAAGTGGTSPIVITTASTTGLATGNAVVITGSTFAAANGTFTITVTSPTTFVLNGTNTLGNGTGGTWATTANFVAPLRLAVRNASAPGGGAPIIITTASTAALATGNVVTISGNPLVAANPGPLNGTFVITVTGPTTFTLDGTNPSAASTTNRGGTWSSVVGFGTAGVATPVGSGPVAATLSDVNQDGRLDAVAANQIDRSFTTVLGAGNGTLLTSLSTAMNNTTTSGVAVGDMNNDGRLDIVAINTNGNNSNSRISIMQGLGGGAYSAPIDFSAGAFGQNARSFTALALGDINGDGRPDVLVTNGQDNSVNMLLNNTTAGANITSSSFTALFPSGTGDSPTGIAVGDFNEDGKLDYAVSHNRGGGGGGSRRGVTVRMGNGDGTFQSRTEYDDGTGMSAVVVADFDKDGNLDFIATEDNSNGPGSIWFHKGDGNGGFTSFGGSRDGLEYTTGIWAPGAIRAADFTGDGLLDVIVSGKGTDATAGSTGVAVLVNSGTGFAPTPLQTDVLPGTPGATPIPGTGLRDVVVTDINQDGFMDAIVSTTLPNLTGTISGASNTTPIVVNVNSTNGLANGMQVVIAGVQGNTAANGTWTISNVQGGGGGPGGGPRFTLTGSVGNGNYTTGGTWTVINSPYVTNDNVFVLTGLGNGRFNANPIPYLAGDIGTPYLASSTIAVTPGALVRVTTFNSGGTVVNAQLVANGDFEAVDLNGETGNLLGWQTFKLNASPGGTRGGWSVQAESNRNKSPLSGTDVTAPINDFRAMLDQANIVPYDDPGNSTNPNLPNTYQGTHLLYQDITIPADAFRVTFSLNLYIDNHDAGTGFSDTTANPSLDFRTPAANQQVRIDIMDPNGSLLGVTAATGVLRNLYLTQANTTTPVTITVTDADLTAFAGRTIRLRIAAANNQGRLIVGVDSVTLIAQFADLVAPTLTGLGVSNPAYVANNIAHTNDPTIVGQIADNSGLKSVAFIVLDPRNDGFGNSDDVKVTQWDSTGNFTHKLDNPPPPAGLNTVGVRVVDRAGNAYTTALSFFMQSNSVTEWEAVGPQGIAVNGQGVDFTRVVGRVTATVADLSDPTGNTYFIGSVNGGVWKTTDGGNHWVSLTNSVTDLLGNPVPVPIGGLAQSTSNPNILYAATGVGDQALDSKPGVGVLKSIDGGQTWTLIGNSNIALAGARAVKVVISHDNPNVAYVGVAAGGASGPGVYKTTDGGLTWANVLNPAFMVTSTGVLSSLTGFAGLESVTDLIMDPANSDRLFIGIGRIGLTSIPAAALKTAGAWFSSSGGAGWTLIQGGFGAIPNNTLPNGPVGGADIGRVTVAIGHGRIGDEGTVYVLMSSVPGNNTPPSVDWGSFIGLFRTTDNMLNFTRVMLRQDILQGRTMAAVNHNFVNINLFARDAANAGAMIVDPNNANVVYIGGSSNWFRTGDAPNHRLIRVDTGNMRDTTYVDAGAIPNDGDDRDKVLRARAQSNFYDPVNAVDPYTGEGVYWYDLNEDQSGDRGQLESLPPSITSLAFDSQGRLLVGTMGGIWRGVPHGFWYDRTSGNTGIISRNYGDPGGGGPGPGGGPPPDFDVPGMTFTSINGNLQIANMTSIAIDPFTRGVYFTTQVATGVAGSSAPLVWTSQGLTGPTIPTATPPNLGIPNAGFVLTSNPNPGLPSPITSATGTASGAITIVVPTGHGLFTGDKVFMSVTGFPQASGNFVITVIDNFTFVLNGTSGIVGSSTVGTWSPAAPEGTPVTLYRVWQYANALALQPETSTDNGATWSSINSSGINTNIPAGMFPAFAVNPNPVFRSGVWQNELMFGTRFVYFSGTSGTVWDPIPDQTPLSPTSANISTLAFAPSTPGVLYAATEDGRFFATMNRGADRWPARITGLPVGINGVFIRGIGVHPYNDQKVFVMYGDRTGTGTPSHVFRSDNGGNSWTNVSSTLPNVAAYAMVIDPRPGLGAPNGKIYLATEIGVFYSLDDGSNWTRLGAGMPNVPVVDLKFDANLNVLAAATLGRGVYTINTSPFSFLSDQVTDEDVPTTPIPFSVNDPGGASYTISATSDNQGLIPDGNIFIGGFGPNRTIQLVPFANANSTTHGTANITVTLVSGTFTYSQAFNFTVNAVNDLPTVTTVGPQVTLKNTPVSVDFTIGDVETAANALVVAATSSNTTVVPNSAANLTLSGAGPFRTLTITPAVNQTGITTITISVTDADFGITQRTFTLLVTTAVTLPFTDDFNRADNTILGPGWNVNAGTATIANSKINFGAGAIVSLNQLSAANVAVQADLTVGANQDLGLIARYAGSGANNYYLALINNINGSNFAQIYRNVNGAFTLLANKAVGFGNGTLRFELADTSLKLFYGPVGGTLALVAYANDSTFLTPSGAVFTAGFRTNSGNVSADNFSATAIPLTTPAVLPFSDNFNSLANGAQLGLNWVNRSGNYSAQSQGMIAANDTNPSVATVYNLALGNSLAQASVNVAGTNSSAGVVARYNSAGYYMGLVVDTGSGFRANIYRVDGAGNVTQIGTSGVIASGAGFVRLEAVGTSLKLFFGATLGTMVQVAYAYDGFFATGATGFRSSAGMRVDDFLTDAITLLTPTFSPSPFIDDFSGPINGNQLSRNWQYREGNYVLSGGALFGADPGVSLATVNGNIGDVAVVVDYTLGGAGQAACFITRYSASGYYLAAVINTGSAIQVNIFKFTPATGFVQLLSAPINGAPSSGTARFESAGTSHKLFINGALSAFAFDSQLTTGSVGLRSTPNVTYDNFQASAIALPTVTLPLTENFGSPTNGNQLSRSWDEIQGNFTVTGGTAIANGGVSLATVHGVSIANTSIRTSFNVGANQHAGVVARYVNTGTFYLGVIVANANASSFTLSIYKFAGGGVTQLATTNVASGAGTMLFEVVGSNLKLFYAAGANPLALALHAYDGAIAAGAAGMRSGGGAVMSNLTLDGITLVDPTVPPGSLPFTESFNTPVNGNQLSRNWLERQGSFRIAGSTLIADDALNLATIHGATLSDTSIRADFNVGASQNAGLVTRYDPATGNFYLAVIVANANATSFALSIYRFLGASVVQLATTNVTSGAGTMLFEVVGSSLKIFYAATGNPLALALYAFDGSLASGLVGVRNGKNAVMANLILDKVTLVNPAAPPGALPFNENFSTPVNGNQMSRNWDERSGEFIVTGTSAVAIDNGITLTTVHDLTLSDPTLQTNVVVGVNQHAGLIARYSANNSFYLAAIVGGSTAGSFTLGIYRSVNGVITQLASGTTNTGTGTLRFDVSGTSLKLYYNGVLQIFAYDATLATGLVGLRVGKNTVVSSFSVNQIVRSTPALPFADNFGAGTVLSSNWSEREGLFNVVAGQAVGLPTAPFSTATVNTAVANSSAQVDLNLPSTGVRHAGLIARFDPATSNMYLARIVSINGVLSAQIFKRVSGAFTQLANATVTGVGTGTARFEVVAGNLKLFFGPTAATAQLVAFANDATPLGGTTFSGIYAGPNDTVDNFNLSAITLQNAVAPFSDNFNAADGSQLSRFWLEKSGNYTVLGNQLISKDTLNIAVVNGLNLTNSSVTSDIVVGTNQQAGLMARFPSDGNWYLGRIRNAGGAFTAEIYRSVGGAVTLLASAPVASGVGTLTFQVVGPNLKLFFGPALATQSLVAFAYDTALTTGTAAILSTAGATYDNFSVAAITLPTTQPSPFNETFTANPPRQQLSNNWLERAGNFNLSTGQAVGQSATNIATVNGINAVGADLQAVVNIAAANQFASLVARYSGNPGVDSYYAGQITFLAANSYRVEIIRVVGGVRTTIGSIIVPTFAGTLRFLVVGSSLSVYLDNAPTPILTLTDNGITAAGGVGMRTSAGARVTSFRST